MHYIERLDPTDTTWQVGTIAEPSPRETAWASGVAYTVEQEVVRTNTHRVYRCAVAHTSAASPVPEDDLTRWKEIKPTDRWLPFGPWVNASGQTIYSGLAVESTTADLTWRMALRFCNAIAVFGVRGARLRVQVYDTPGGVLVHERVTDLKQPATGYWGLIYGQRTNLERVVLSDLPMYPNAEVVLTVEGGSGQLRRITQLEAGKLRQIHGADFGGTEYGISNTPRARLYREQDTDGTERVLLYGVSQDMEAVVSMAGGHENTAIAALRSLSGRGVALLPTLSPGYEQRLTFGVIDSAPVTRTSYGLTQVRFSVRGLPTD